MKPLVKIELAQSSLTSSRADITITNVSGKSLSFHFSGNYLQEETNTEAYGYFTGGFVNGAVHTFKQLLGPGMLAIYDYSNGSTVANARFNLLGFAMFYGKKKSALRDEYSGIGILCSDSQLMPSFISSTYTTTVTMYTIPVNTPVYSVSLTGCTPSEDVSSGYLFSDPNEGGNTPTLDITGDPVLPSYTASNATLYINNSTMYPFTIPAGSLLDIEATGNPPPEITIDYTNTQPPVITPTTGG